MIIPLLIAMQWVAKPRKGSSCPEISNPQTGDLVLRPIAAASSSPDTELLGASVGNRPAPGELRQDFVDGTRALKP